PGDSVTVTGDRLQGDVEQPFLLPHDIAAGELHEDIRIARLELKGVVERQLHGHERHREALPEVVIVLDPPSVADGVEVARDRPGTCGGGASRRSHRRAHRQYLWQRSLGNLSALLQLDNGPSDRGAEGPAISFQIAASSTGSARAARCCTIT